jgi:hypothetical protein
MRPSIPPPTTHTSTRSDAPSAGYVVCGAVSIQREVGRPEMLWVMRFSLPG